MHFLQIIEVVVALEDDEEKAIKRLGIRRMVNIYHFGNDLEYFDNRIGDMTPTMKIIRYIRMLCYVNDYEKESHKITNLTKEYFVTLDVLTLGKDY